CPPSAVSEWRATIRVNRARPGQTGKRSEILRDESAIWGNWEGKWGWFYQSPGNVAVALKVIRANDGRVWFVDPSGSRCVDPTPTNHTVVTEGWLDQLLPAGQVSPASGLVGALSNCAAPSTEGGRNGY